MLLLTGMASLAACAYSCASTPPSKATKDGSTENEPAAIVEAGCIGDAGEWIPAHEETSAGGKNCGYAWRCLPDGSFVLSRPPTERDFCPPPWCMDSPPADVDGGKFRAFPPFTSFPARDGCNTCKCEVYDKDKNIYQGPWEIEPPMTVYFSRIVCTNLACPDASADAAPLDAGDASDATGD